MGQIHKLHYCTFCGKNHTEVERLIKGPDDTGICNECVTICNTVIAENRAIEAKAAKTKSKPD